METKKSKYSGNQQGSAVQNDVLIHRVFDLPVSKVWRALTVAEEFKKWWGPKDFSCPSSKMEAKVGGKYLNCMRGPDGKDYRSTGVLKQQAILLLLCLYAYFLGEINEKNKGNRKSDRSIF